MSDDAPKHTFVRHVEPRRNEMIRAIVEASPDASMVLAILDEAGGALIVTPGTGNKDQAFMGQVIVHDAMRDAFGEGQEP